MGNQLRRNISVTAGRVYGTTVSKWLILTITGSQTGVPVGGTSTITADLTHNNLGEDTSSLGFVPDGMPVNFNVLNPLLGFVNPTTTFTVNGTVSSLFTSLTTGLETVNVTVDSQTLQQQFEMGTVDLLVRNYEWYPNRDNNTVCRSSTLRVICNELRTRHCNQHNSKILNWNWSNIPRLQPNNRRNQKVTYDGQNLTYYINNLPANSIAIILIYLQTNTTGTQTPTHNHRITNTVDQNKTDTTRTPKPKN